MTRVLMLHDRFGTRTALESWLARGDEVDLASTAEEAVERLGVAGYDACIVDVGSVEDVTALQELRRRRPTLPVVACIPSDRVAEGAAVVRLGVEAVLIAPVSVEALAAVGLPLMGGAHARGEALARQVDEVLSQQYRDAGLRPAGVARRSRIHVRTLARLCGEHLGESCSERLTRYRLEAAKRLLEDTDEPLKVVADLCGFGGEGQLRSAWRRREGTTPGAYRRACVRVAEEVCPDRVRGTSSIGGACALWKRSVVAKVAGVEWHGIARGGRTCRRY